ncbi:MAG: LysM peptidoglycan-binding domain-containing protein, partial [Acidimicrobiales bacterium]
MRRPASSLRAPAALAALAGLLVAPPALLWMAVGWPGPTFVPRVDGLGDYLAPGSISDEVIIKVVALVAWACWAIVAASILVELRAAARHRQAGRVRLLGPAQMMARRLVASVALLLTLPSEPSGGRPLPVLVASVSTPAPVPEPPVPQVADAPAGTVAHVVAPRESLWTIAARHLGDGAHWREIFELNRGRLQDDGRRLESPGLLRPGWKLLLPGGPPGSAEAVAAALAEPGDGGAAHPTHVVEARDTMWALAERYLGDPTRWTEIRDLNLGQRQGGRVLGDHRALPVGWVLRLPVDAVPGAVD